MTVKEPSSKCSKCLTVRFPFCIPETGINWFIPRTNNHSVIKISAKHCHWKRFSREETLSPACDPEDVRITGDQCEIQIRIRETSPRTYRNLRNVKNGMLRVGVCFIKQNSKNIAHIDRNETDCNTPFFSCPCEM